MTQPQLATAAGVTQPSISDLETGETKEISGTTLISISTTLRVRPEWLVTGKEPMEASETDSITEDERELLDRYRAASGRWKISIRYVAGMKHDAQQEEAVSYVMSKIFATPVSDRRVEEAYGRPPSLHEKKEEYAADKPKRRKS